MDFDGFSEVTFSPAKGQLPESGGFVYIFFWVADRVETPIYVGQTNGLAKRMEDYEQANFAASTDFRVGEAAKYLRNTRMCRVVVKYKPSKDPPKDEREIIRTLVLEGARLLNCLPSYDYHQADEESEREAVQRFCDMLTGIRR